MVTVTGGLEIINTQLARQAQQKVTRGEIFYGIRNERCLLT